MIGSVHRFDAPTGLREGELAVVDLPALGHQAGDRAQAGGHPGGAPAGELGQVVQEHPLIELVGLSIHVEIGAGITGQQHRASVPGRSLQQVVDQGVFRTAHGGGVELRRGPHVLGVVATGVGRGEHQGRRGAGVRPANLERRLELQLGDRRREVSSVHVASCADFREPGQRGPVRVYRRFTPGG